MNKTGSYISDSTFVNQISGLIKWEYNHRGYIAGDFKQIENPAAFEILPENIVQRGCQVSHCKFMVCLALNVGLSCMGNGYRSPELIKMRIKKSPLDKKILQRRESPLFRTLRSVQIISVIFCFLPCILTIFQEFTLKNTQMGLFTTKFVQLQYSNSLLYVYILLEGLTGFMVNLPLLSHLCMEAVVYFHAYFVIWDVNLVPANISFTNLRTMKTLGQVDTIICSKAAFINPNLSYIAAFKVGDIICYNEVGEKVQQVERDLIYEVESQSSSEASDDDDRENLEYLPNQTQIVKDFKSTVADQFLEDAHPQHENFKELLLALTLCHHATIQTSQMTHQQQGKLIYKSLYKEEESQLKFADSFGYQLKIRKDRKLTILKQGKSLQRFEETIIRKFKYQDDWITVQVIKPFGTSQSGVKIYYKGNLRIIQQMLRKDENYNCEKDFDKFSKEGIHAIGIAKREIDAEEAVELHRILQDNSSKKGQDDKSEEILIYIARNLELLGVIGMKSVTNIRDALLMQELRQNGVKLVILNTDSTSETITDLNALKMFNQYRKPINIVGRTDREVAESLKNQLKQLVEKQMIKPQSHQDAFVDDLPASHKMKLRRHPPKMNKKEKLSSKSISSGVKQKQNNKRDSLQEFFDRDQKNSVFVNGESLYFILKDETLTQLFLTLCSYCTLVVGSSVTPYQKRDLTAAIRQFSIQGDQGYVVAVVVKQADKFVGLEADITIGIQRIGQQSDLLASSDMQMRDIYGISYLLFKHGTILQRRLRVVLNQFVYRTIVVMVVSLLFFITTGFSAVQPYNQFFFASYMSFFTPILFFLEGIMHTDYGYGILHRILGEYKLNKAQKSGFVDLKPVLLSASFDSALICFFYIAWGSQWNKDLHFINGGHNHWWQTKTTLNSVILTLSTYWRYRSTLCVTQLFSTLNFFILCVQLVFILADSDLMGVLSLVESPYGLAVILFFLLTLNLKAYICFLLNFFTPKSRQLVKHYQEIEDRLYMEEYEDPEQKFEISSSVDFVDLVRQTEDQKIFSINQNLLKVHRSDSIDKILEWINVSGGQSTEGRNNFTNRSLINKWNLKLNDINKEIEYNEVIISEDLLKNCVSLIWTSTTLYGIIAVFKILNQIVESDDSISSALNGNKTQERSDTAGSKITTIYFEVFEVLVSLLAIFLIKKVKTLRSDMVIFSLIVIFNITVNLYFYIDHENPLIQIQFLYTIAFSHLIRLNSVFFVSLICLASAIQFLNIRLSTIQEITETLETTREIQLVWEASAGLLYIFFWTYYSYWDEIKQKVHFVTHLRQIKELQKLKSIINIQIPSIVRSKTQDGAKNFSEAQGEVTVIFVDIESFDEITQEYTGKELIELIDRVYNSFDSICENHGLQKIETIGKRYTACAGLKVFEKEIDIRLLGSHHSVRVTDFACSVKNYVQTQTLRSSKRLSAKLGIHTGEVIAGVIGETRPQFSLIGPTINKASRVCSLCPANSILISKQTHQNLLASASNFVFGSMKVYIKGTGLEEVFTVQKRSTQRSKLVRRRREIIHKKQTQNSTPDKARLRLYNSETTHKNSVQSSGNMDQRSLNSQREQNEDSNGGRNMQTVRTVGSNLISEQLSSINNDSAREQQLYMNDSQEANENDDVVKTSEFQDDKKIVINAVQNERYNLVERPRFLLSFELKDQENVFLHSLLKENYSLEIFQLVSKSFIDLIIIECLVYTFLGTDNIYIYICVLLGQAILTVALLCYMRRLTSQGVMIFLMIQIIGIAVSMIFFIINGPKFRNFLLRSSQQVTLGIYQAIIIISKAIPFRVFASVQIILYIALICQNFFFIDLDVINLQTYVIDSILQLVLFALLILASHSREMKVRRQYNQKRIIDVEIEKTQELLSKLLPKHILEGILNDQRVVDQIDNVTILYTDMVGLTEFYKNSDSQVVFNFLSSLFTKFDQLCEQFRVYKVHTIGDCYVIMSYSGDIPQEKRSSAVQIDEAFRVIQVAFEMIKVIAKERTESKIPALKNLDIRIGIHTGKIVGGVIGTKLVRYDIFGQDVQIANKMEAYGIKYAVCISEQTYKLLHAKNLVQLKFEFTEHRPCQIGTSGKSIKSYIVKQILEDVKESSEESERGVTGRNDYSNSSSKTDDFGSQGDSSSSSSDYASQNSEENKQSAEN